jgi:hypothetical protein
MTEKTKTKHGGARPGAGRPAKDGQPREKITVTIPAHLRDKLDVFAATNGINRSEAVSMVLDTLNLDNGIISLLIK